MDRTFVGQMLFPDGLLAQFDSGFAAPDRQQIEIVGTDATLVLDRPFLTAPDGPAVAHSRPRRGGDGRSRSADGPVPGEVEDLTAAILDGTPPRIDLAFSRGTIATLVALDRAARAAVPGSDRVEER